MPRTKQKPSEQLHTNDALPTLAVDSLTVFSRLDDMSLLRFSTSLPEGIFEQVRLLISQKDLLGMTDTLCEALDHYPVKPTRKEKKVARNENKTDKTESEK